MGKKNRSNKDTKAQKSKPEEDAIVSSLLESKDFNLQFLIFTSSMNFSLKRKLKKFQRQFCRQRRHNTVSVIRLAYNRCNLL